MSVRALSTPPSAGTSGPHCSGPHCILAMNRVVFEMGGFPVPSDYRYCVPMARDGPAQRLLAEQPGFESVFTLNVDLLGMENAAKLMRSGHYCDYIRRLGHVAVTRMLEKQLSDI